jgi:TonB-linked SusC/RagA family outer membrane protein
MVLHAYCKNPRNDRFSLHKTLLVMKLTGFLIVILTFQVTAKTFSQKVNLHARNITLDKVFKMIQQQTGYSFLCDQDLLDKNKTLSLYIKDASVKEALDICLEGIPVTYKFKGKVVFIDKIPPLPEGHMVTNGQPADSASTATNIAIKGIVTGEKDEPLSGATIHIKGTTRGTTTNDQGEFELKNVDASAVLVCSFIGYDSLEIRVHGKNYLSFKLKPGAGGMNDFVIVGYGSQKKANLTGAVATISGDILQDRPIPDIGRGIQGLLPGLNVTSSSGQPGVGSDFNIRGFTSLNGGSPLILVDGVPTDINYINPGDVASVTVLKDAASATVYGSRAPFGVILITTRTGKKGGVKVTYSGNYAVHKITHGMENSIVTDPGTVADYTNEAYSGYYGANLFSSAYTAYAHERSKNMSLPSVIVSPDDPTKYAYVGNTNWFHELYAPDNSSSINNLSVTGGSDNINYYFSGGYNRQNGVFRYDPDYYNRYNLRARLDFQATKWLKIYTNSAYNRTDYNSASLWSSDLNSVFGDLYHATGRNSTLSVLKNPDGSWAYSGPYFGRGGVMIGFMADGARSNTVTNQTQNTLGFEASFFGNKWRIKGDYTFRSTNDYNRTFHISLPYENAPDQLVNQYGQSDASNTADNISYHITNLYTEYENTFAKKHYLKGMVGVSQELNDYENFNASNTNLISSQVGYLNQTTGVLPSVGGGAYQWAVQGLFYRVNYIYNNKYLLELDGRYDGSSRFPVNNKYGFFPSASAGWKISEEPFFDGFRKVVSNLKFRASYGSLGNDQSLGNYDFIPTLNSGTISQILGGTQPLAVYNPNLVASNLTWEKVYNKNLGVDVTVVKKIDMTFDLYRRDTKNMITTGFQLPAVLGNSQPQENAADLKTTGWEFSIAYHDQVPLAGKPFRYNVRFNLWDNQTTITKYYNPTNFWFGDGSENTYYTGQKLGDVWGLKTIGIFQSDAEGKSWADQSKVAGYYPQNVAGEMKYADLNHDGKVNYGDGTVANPGDARVIANTNPRYSFGFTGQFSWNNFDIGFIFQGVFKRDFIPNGGYYWSSFYAPWENVQKNIIGNTWTPQTPNAFFPSLKGWRAGDDGPWVDLAVPQTRYVLNAAYIRLKNLNIGYSISPGLLKKAGIDQIRFYVSGEDLWEHTKLPKVFDPEGLGGSWGSGKVYPFQRAFSFGLSARF